MNRKGVTLIELMIALVISTTIVAAIYRIFLTQQSAYTVQDDVVDMQQSVRVAVNEMMREIRMAGFGNVQSRLPVTINGTAYNNVINPDTPTAGALTFVAGLGGAATLTGFNPPNRITVSSLVSSSGSTLFDTVDRRYISIAGSECFVITGIAGNTLTLGGNVSTAFKTDPNEPDPTKNVTAPVSVYAVRAITYVVLPNASGAPVLRRNENLGGGNVSLADDIENVAFQYLDANGNPTATPPDVRTVRVTVTARTKSEDPKLKAGAADGYRRRQVASNILLRNMGL
jgi:prepilin-type N-terminal cleavage/methylation domain-containing protein